MAKISGITVSIDNAILEILEDIINRLNKLESNIADVKESKPFVVKDGKVYISEDEKSTIQAHNESWVLVKAGTFIVN